MAILKTLLFHILLSLHMPILVISKLLALLFLSGKMIMQSILAHPQLSRLKYFELTCAPELAKYYRQFGFSEDYGNVVAMRNCKQSAK